MSESTTKAAPGATASPTRSVQEFGPAKVGLWAPPIALFIVLIGAWYGLHYALGERGFLVPEPHFVLERLFDASAWDDIWSAMLQTTGVALTGLAIAIVIGVAWAVLMNQAKWIERTTFPYAVVLQAIPILAIVPLIGFWFGYDFIARTIVCVLIALFPIVSNTLFGLQSTTRAMDDLFTLKKAGRWTRLIHLQLPAALPAMFTGLRIAAGMAVVGSIVADFFFRRGEAGIGLQIDTYRNLLDGEMLYGAIILASLLGLATFWLFGLLSRLVVGSWYRPHSR